MNDGTKVNKIWLFAIFQLIDITKVVAKKYNGILNNLDEVNVLFLQDLIIPVIQSASINTQSVYIAEGSL